MNKFNTILQPARSENDERKKRKASLIKLLIMLVLSFVIWIFSTIAWFAHNDSVNANNMGITVSDIPFEIAVQGSNIREDAKFTQADSNYTYGNSSVIDGCYVSDGSHIQIKIRYNPPVANDPVDFGPGSSGELHFSVIPKQNGNLTVRIGLDVTGFKDIGEDNNKTLKRISELTTSDPDVTQDLITQYAEAENYLKGHIMFFEAPGRMDGASADRFYYSSPITSRYFEKTFTNAQKDHPEEVTLYWMWTNTFGQIALRNNNSNLREDYYPVVQDVFSNVGDISSTDKGKVIQYLKDNKSSIFAGLTESSQEIDAMIDSASDTENFRKLSTSYNDADFIIGSNLSYFLIDLSVEAAN